MFPAAQRPGGECGPGCGGDSISFNPRAASTAFLTGLYRPEGKRGQGAVSGFLWGSLTGERGPGRRVGPQHHREGRPGRPEQPSQGAAEGLAAGLPAPGFIVTNCWDGQCPWTGGTHAACSSGNSRCSPRPFLRSRGQYLGANRQRHSDGGVGCAELLWGSWTRFRCVRVWKGRGAFPHTHTHTQGQAILKHQQSPGTQLRSDGIRMETAGDSPG